MWNISSNISTHIWIASYLIIQCWLFSVYKPKYLQHAGNKNMLQVYLCSIVTSSQKKYDIWLCGNFNVSTLVVTLYYIYADPSKCQDGVTNNCTQLCTRTSSGNQTFYSCSCEDGQRIMDGSETDCVGKQYQCLYYYYNTKCFNRYLTFCRHWWVYR